MAAVLNPNDETIIGTSQKPTQDPPDIMTSDSNQMVTVMVPDVETTTGTSQNPMDDLSGVDTSPYGNPFDALISKANETYVCVLGLSHSFLWPGCDVVCLDRF